MLIRTTLLLFLVVPLNPVHCMETELCVPVDVDHRHRDGTSFQNLENEKRVLKIRAFQQDLVLRVHRDSSFIAPSLAAQARFWSPGTDDPTRCFYSGHVNSDPDSYAALSLCKGLRGAFGFQGWEYFISPAENSTGEHVLRRRTAPEPGSTSRCGVDGGISPQAARSLEKYKHVHDQGNGTEGMLRRIGRAKRFASVPRYVETLVVADQSMVQFHGEDLKHYLLTLMSVAARLYRHPSILNFINIAVVKIVIITEEDKGPKVSGNAAMTLRNFCTWQKKMNKNTDKHPEYWDTAILFTRQVIKASFGTK